MTGIQAEGSAKRDPVTGVILGAEPFSFGEGREAVLFLHGWTSTPRELRFLAERIARSGFHCQGPLLPGHGTCLADLAPTRFPDYLEAAEKAYEALAASHARVTVCGLSMGGLLGLELAVRRPVAGLILVAPFIHPSGRTLGLPNRWLVGRVPLPATLPKSAGGPIADPEGAKDHIAYHAMPTGSMVSVVRAARAFLPKCGRVACPALILHSVGDATSDFTGSQLLIEKLGGEDKTLVAFNRGNHVITLDYHKQRIEETADRWLSARSGMPESA